MVSLGSLLLIVLLVVVLLAVMPRWNYSRGWGYGPSGILMVLLILAIVLLLMGRL